MATGKPVSHIPLSARLSGELVDVKSKLGAIKIKHFGADYFADRLALSD